MINKGFVDGSSTYSSVVQWSGHRTLNPRSRFDSLSFFQLKIFFISNQSVIDLNFA